MCYQHKFITGESNKDWAQKYFLKYGNKPVSQQKWDVNTFSCCFPIGFTGPALS